MPGSDGPPGEVPARRPPDLGDVTSEIEGGPTQAPPSVVVAVAQPARPQSCEGGPVTTPSDARGPSTRSVASPAGSALTAARAPGSYAKAVKSAPQRWSVALPTIQNVKPGGTPDALDQLERTLAKDWSVQERHPPAGSPGTAGDDGDR
ncbi:hypothetical protein PI124_g16431 [Phytophthora idaei]|nr:hypothetical protein PI125_g23898 [Phytophthora idaei]KAG3128180.1 hypothetical protein PI126_g21507 [Phytophthora idaei]KAG3238610.1 hypothetical protein PI124_g16431 [Phytophthora idaei]